MKNAPTFALLRKSALAGGAGFVSAPDLNQDPDPGP